MTSPTVLSYSDTFPGAPFSQHIAGKSTTLQSYLYPGAVQPQASATVLSYNDALLGAPFSQHLSGKSTTLQSYLYPGAVQPQPQSGASGRTGSLSETLSALTTASTGLIRTSGISSTTFANATLAASALVRITGLGAEGLSALALSGTGTVGSLPRTGSLSETLAALQAAASGLVSIDGSGLGSLAPVTLAAVSRASISGSGGQLLSALSGASVGRVSVAAQAAAVLASLTDIAAGTVTSVRTGQGVATLADLTALVNGLVKVQLTGRPNLATLSTLVSGGPRIVGSGSKALSGLIGTGFGATLPSITVDPRKYLTVPPYKARVIPLDQASFARALLGELQRLQQTVANMGQGTATAVEPRDPLIGMQRYATGRWADQLGAEGLYIYTASGWTRIV